MSVSYNIDAPSTPLAVLSPQNIVLPKQQAPNVGIAELLQAFLSGKSQKTVTAYSKDLASFAEYIGALTLYEAAGSLLQGGHGSANLQAIRYKDALAQQGLSPATINRRLSALRSLVQLAKTLGIVGWDLQVPSVRSQSFRDTRGVSLDSLRLLCAAASSQRSRRKAARDTAILRLLFDLALRRSEVAGLDYEDVDLAGSRVWVLGKGKTEKAPMTLPDPTKKAIKAWLSFRGTEAGALFFNCDRAGKGHRLTDSGLYRMVCYLGDKVRVRARPHGIRHSAITEVLDLMNGNLRVAQKFARHSSANTTTLYDDNRQDLAGEASKMLAAVMND